MIDYAYTGQWKVDHAMVLELKDYADRYGFDDFGAELGSLLTTILGSKPEDVMTIAAQASAMGVSTCRVL